MVPQKDTSHLQTVSKFVNLSCEDRTREVVLNRGFFWQRNLQDWALRMTTEEEKQALLLHEILHIALDRDDDDLTRRGLCPLRLLASCPRVSTAAAPTE